MKYIFAPFILIKNSRLPPRKQTAQSGPDYSHKIYSGSPLVVLTEMISNSDPNTRIKGENTHMKTLRK